MTVVATRRVVLVTRRTAYEQLLEHHATPDQARFFLETRGQTLEEVAERHFVFEKALRTVSSAVPVDWRRTRVTRSDLDRFLFEEDDVIVALGQDGLVANVAKYLDGQPVIGLNPEPDVNPGVLVPHAPRDTAELLAAVAVERQAIEERAMVAATLDDGQQLVALNEMFVGHGSHQSARYTVDYRGRSEMQSSSGMIVATGTGSTGWAASIHRSRGSSIALPQRTSRALTFFVREAWPSIATGTEVVEGRLDDGEELVVTSRMDDGGAIFGDGIESDSVPFPWGARVRLSVAERRLRLVAG